MVIEKQPLNRGCFLAAKDQLAATFFGGGFVKYLLTFGTSTNPRKPATSIPRGITALQTGGGKPIIVQATGGKPSKTSANVVSKSCPNSLDNKTPPEMASISFLFKTTILLIIIVSSKIIN
ncbi:hypothetical protein GAMM_110036 [Gammaproteobacteria bacterium]